MDGTEIMDETPAGNTLEDVFGADGLEVAYGGVSLPETIQSRMCLM